MQDVATQGPPGADTTSEANMRDSSKRQADVGVEELEHDTNDGSDEAATLGDDAEMGVESQGEQAPGLSGVDVTKVHNLAHTTSVTVTGDKSCHLQNVSEKPYVLITSPLCTALSKLTSLNVRHTSPSERRQIANKAQRHFEFICKLIMIQHRDGRYFIHEHPGGISSWQGSVCSRGIDRHASHNNRV